MVLQILHVGFDVELWSCFALGFFFVMVRSKARFVIRGICELWRGDDD